MNEASIEKFRDVLRKFDTAILATISSQGQIHARPMAIFQIDGNGDVIFITDEQTAKVQEIEKNPSATVICQNGWSSTVTVIGRAVLFHDPARLRENWKKTFEAWFPNGPDDPRITLVRVEGEQGEFWDNSGFKSLRYMYQATKAVVTGSRPEIDRKDQHGKVTLT
jgi:general stress protein 26